MATITKVRKAGRPVGSRQYKQIVKMPAPSLDECIIAILRSHASGRVPVSSRTIAVQLMIRYGIDRCARSVRNDLQRLQARGVVVSTGVKKPYKLCLQSAQFAA